MTNQATYRAAVVKAPGQLELVERPIPAPAQGQVRIRVEACGVCHSDSATVEREAPDGAPPRVPGHEVVGRSTRSAKGCPAGGSANVSASAFSPVKIARARRAGTAMS